MSDKVSKSGKGTNGVARGIVVAKNACPECGGDVHIGFDDGKCQQCGMDYVAVYRKKEETADDVVTE